MNQSASRKVLHVRAGVVLVVAVIAGLLFRFAKPGENTAIPAKSAEVVLPKPQQHQRLAGPALIERLKKGDLVLFVRHFQTRHKNIRDDARQLEHATLGPEDYRDCTWQRPLSDEGRLKAEAVGKAWKQLGIPTGKVIASPYCRAVETAKLLTGREPERDADLVFVARNQKVEERVKKIVPYLTAPASGGNTVIAAHRTKLMEKIDEGTVVIFEPLPNGEFNLVAEVRAEEWILATQDPQFLAISHLGEAFKR